MGWIRRLLGLERKSDQPDQTDIPTLRVTFGATYRTEESSKSGRMPTVSFDPRRVTQEIKDDLRASIDGLKDFEEAHRDQVYEAAVLSISGGRDMVPLVKAVVGLGLPGMTKSRAGDIATLLNNKATALINQNQQIKCNVKYAKWIYSGAPCMADRRHPSKRDLRMDAAHKAADGKRYSVAKGMLLNSHRTLPGREEGCKCVSGSIIPGLD